MCGRGCQLERTLSAVTSSRWSTVKLNRAPRHWVPSLPAVEEGCEMEEEFEAMLSGGHPNSLGRTEEVVDLVLADRGRLAALVDCYLSADEVVRLRVSSALKRVTIARPDWTIDFMDQLQDEVASIDQPSTQWTLALIFDLTRDLLTAEQRARAVEIMQNNLVEHDDWIVLNNSMKVLGAWADGDRELQSWLRPHARRLSEDPRKSVASNACKLLRLIGG